MPSGSPTSLSSSSPASISNQDASTPPEGVSGEPGHSLGDAGASPSGEPGHALGDTSGDSHLHPEDKVTA